MWRVVLCCAFGLWGFGFGAGCGDDGSRVDPELDTTIDDGPTALTNQSAATFAFHSDPAGDDFLCTLDGGEIVQCGSPYTVTVTDGAHTFTVAALGARATFDPTPAAHTWTVDATPPDTQITLAPAAIDNTAMPVFEFTGADTAGTITLECALDAAPFAACTSPATLTVVDGAHTFAVRAVDAAGNVDATPASHAWTIDSTAPDTAITAGPASGATTGPTTELAFTSPEATATFECALDAEPFAACTTPRPLGPLAGGSHTFAVRAKDMANVVDPTPATRTWTVDATPPDIAITATPLNPSNDATPSFEFASSDPTALYECQIDGIVAFTACTSAWTGPIVPDGGRTFRVRATDPFGNTATAMHSWVVDTVAPTVVITSGPTGAIATSAATFGFSASGAPSVIECSMDGGAFAACATPKAYTDLPEGAHVFVVRVADPAGNPAQAMRAFTTDTIGPVVMITSGPPNPTNNPTPTFAFAVTGATTVTCRVDAAAFAPCTSPLTTGTLTSASHTFTVRGTDAVGNMTDASQMFVVDLVAPTVTITSQPANPTNDPTAAIAFTVTGATGAQCQVDAGAFADCASPFTSASLADGSHTITVRATDAAGNAGSDSATFVVDTVAPVVTIIDPSSPSNDPSPSIAFAVTGGAVSTQCQVDAGAFAACTSPFVPSLADGTHTVTVRATDSAGNPGTDSTMVTIDTQPPTVTLAPVANPTSDATPTLTFTTAGAPVTIECSLDGGAFAACTSPFTTPTLSDASHTVTVRATDAAGNPGSASRTFVVDTLAPVVVITGPDDPTNDPTPQITFAVSGGATSTQCQIDTGTFATCSSPFTSTALADGSHVIVVRATDAAGNPGMDATMFVVDTAPPIVAITSGPTGLTTDPTPTFTFTVTGGPAPTTCRFDSAPAISCTSPVTPSVALADGNHTLVVTATDTAGNPGSGTQGFTVDATAPVVSITGGPSGPTSDATPTFTFTVSGGPATTTCRIDAAMFVACSAAFTPSADLADGTHTFEVLATDTAGNPDTATRSFTVDTAPPDVTITTFPADPTNDPTPAIAFVVTGGPATTTCKVGSAAAVACTSPFSPSAALASGSYVFTVVATDGVGLTDSDSVTIVVDTVAPTLVLVGPATPTSDPTPTATFTVTAGGPASTTCKVDAGAFAPCTSPFTLPTLLDGSHTLTVRATDAATNFDEEVATFVVDTVPPALAFDDVPPASWPVDYYDIKFHAPGATTTCSLDGAAFASCTSPVVLTDLPYGNRTFDVRATDAAGNTTSVSTGWTSATGLVLHYPWEQGDVDNTSLLVQRPSYSVAGTATQTAIGGWGGTAIASPAAHLYRRTVRPLSSSPAGAYTASIWIRTGANGANGVLWSNVGPAGGVELAIEGTQIKATLYAGATAFPMTEAIPSMRWVNIAVTTTGTAKGLGLWIDGVQTDFVNPGAANGFGAFQGPDVTVGSLTTASLDDLRFYNTAFTTAEMCTVVARGVTNQDRCTLGAPLIELDLERNFANTGFWGVSVAPSTGAVFTPTTLGDGIKIDFSEVGFGVRGFAAFANTVPGHSISFWMATGGIDTVLFDFVQTCGFAAPANCGMHALYLNGRLRIDTYINSTTPKTIEIPVDGGYHGIVITEQKSAGVTTQLTIYVDGVPSVLAVGGGNVFASVNDMITLTSSVGVMFDELELWGRDLSEEPQMLCENGFDGAWDHVEAKCVLTSN